MSEDTDFNFLLEKVYRNKSVDFSLYKPNTLKRRIASRLRKTGCRNYSDYIIYLNKEPEEYNRLIEAVTINVTEFFRNPEAFHVIEKSYPGYNKNQRKRKAQGHPRVERWCKQWRRGV